MSTAGPLRVATLRGLGWLTGAQGARQLLQIGLRVLLARLLAPDDFGLLAMVTVFSGFLLMVNDLGFGPALVRKETVTEEELSTVFWCNAVTGVVMALATAGLGPLLARLYHEAALAPICLALALGSLAAPLGSVHNALLQRRLAFRSLAKIDVIGLAAGGLAAVGLALRGSGVWALVWQINVTAVGTLVITLAEAGWHPCRCFSPAAAAKLWRFGGDFTAASLLNYCVRNLDNLLIGRFLGATALGFYVQAYQLMLYPVQNIAAVAGRVMFPTLAAVQADRERVRRGYLRALRGIAALTFPLMLGAMVLAPDMYAVLFGPRWRPAVFLFQVLCGLGMLQSIGTTVGWIYLATGRTDLLLRWTLLAAGVILPGFLVGLQSGGLRGLTLAYAATSGLLFLPSLAPAFRLIQLSLVEVAERLAPMLAAALGMTMTIAVFRWLLPPDTGPTLRLLLGILTGLAAYPALLHLLRQAPAAGVRSLWASLRPR